MFDFSIAVKGSRLEHASILCLLRTQAFGFKGINSYVHGGNVCKVRPNINPFVGSIHMKPPPSSQPIDIEVTSTLKDKGYAIIELANKQVDDWQKARATMKPPSVARKEFHMDKASEDVSNGDKSIDKSREEDDEDAKERKGASSENDEEPIKMKKSRSTKQILEVDEDGVIDFQHPKAKRKKANTH